MPLNERQKRFVDEYLKLPNATKAARRAGYSERTARQQGTRLLSNVAIQSSIAERSSKIREQADIDAAQVLERLTLMADTKIGDLFDDEGKLLDPKELPAGAQYLVARLEIEENYELVGKERKRVFTGYTKKIKLESRLKALEMIGKHIAVQPWTGKHPVEGDVPLMIYRDYTGGAHTSSDDPPNDVPATSLTAL